jgi:hypothetical protein
LLFIDSETAAEGTQHLLRWDDYVRWNGMKAGALYILQYFN